MMWVIWSSLSRNSEMTSIGKMKNSKRCAMNFMHFVLRMIDLGKRSRARRFSDNALKLVS